MTRSYAFDADPATRSGTTVHGSGQRPSKADLTPIDPALLAEFNAGTRKAIDTNRLRPMQDRIKDGQVKAWSAGR